MEEGRKEHFLKRKNIEFTVQRYLIDAMSYMALGLFASLIVGTILNTLGDKLGIVFFTDVLWPIAQKMTGPAIGVAVAYGLQAPPLVYFHQYLPGRLVVNGRTGWYFWLLWLVPNLVRWYKETKLDIIVTPAVTIILGVLMGRMAGPGVAALMTGLGR